MSFSLPLVCPACHGQLDSLGLQKLVCREDGLAFPNQHGIWCFLPPDRSAYYDRFLYEYNLVRLAEGRGDLDPGYYQRLPYVDPSDRYKSDWDLRARSYQTFLRQIIVPQEAAASAGLKILDLGAGNGWLSNRLARRDHQLAAVDLRVGKLDGLGAVVHYNQPILAVQAEFDCLPFEDGLFDLVVYNASLHYSEVYRTTLQEALRVLAGSGWLAVVDTPYYHDPGSGIAMVREREERFAALYGFPSNVIPAENYLTWAMIETLGSGLGIDWQFFWPDYGLKWRFRRLKEHLFGRREPANFPVILGKPSNRRFAPYALKEAGSTI